MPMKRERNPSIDALRGLVMVLMVLDHVRDYFAATPFDPTDPSATSPIWFAMRWVTHLCAPVFVLLAGTAAWFKAKKTTRMELSRWLVIRGLWLIFIELTLNSFLWFGTGIPGVQPFLQVQVLWAIGISMIALALLCHLPRWCVASLVLAMIAGHNLLDGAYSIAPPGQQGAGDFLWALLHERGFFPLAQFAPLAERFPMGALFVNYPAVPWIGALAAGWVLGPWFETAEGETERPRDSRRSRRFLLFGIALCALFVALRYANVYGDPAPWTSSDRGSLYTAFSFLNCQKYPPSLSFLLMTLGPAFVILALLELTPRRLLSPLVTYGRVPFFFYLTHIALVHAAAAAYANLSGRDAGWWWQASMPGAAEPVASPWPALIAWPLVTATLYPACVYWGKLKAAGHRWTALL